MAKVHVVQTELLVAFLATILICLPAASQCARVVGMTETHAADSGYSVIAAPSAEYCVTDFSRVSYEEVKAACPTDSNGATAACCAAFNKKACQYEAQVNNFDSTCPMLFVNYLAAAGPYPPGYFVGPCVHDAHSGICVRSN